MKLKRIHVLLIIMSIFLLVSIGSVCAESTSDADIQTASDDSVDVLADEPTNGGSNGDPVQEKIETSIYAEDNKQFNVQDEKNIAVNVKDNESNTTISGITKENLTVTDNGKSIDSFVYNNSIITFNNLAVGLHKINITYNGNEYYNSSSTLIHVTIIKDNDLVVPSTVSSDGSTAEIQVNFTDGVHDNTNLLNNENTVVTLKYGDTNETVTVDWNEVATTKKLIVNVNNHIPATVTINYTNNETGKTIVKLISVKFATHVVITPTTLNINENENATFNVTVIDADGNKINITNKNLTITTTHGGNVTYNGTTNIMEITGLKKGIYNLTITYKGDDINYISRSPVLINVHGAIDINTNGTSVKVNSTKKGEIQIINITDSVDIFNPTKDDLNLTVVYKDGNDTKIININDDWDVINGTIFFTLEHGNFTTANLTIDYKNGNSTKNITLNRIYNANIVVKWAENDYLSGNFTFKLVDIDDNDAGIANKQVTLTSEEVFSKTIGSITSSNSISFSATTNSEGILNFKNSNLRPLFYSFENNEFNYVWGDPFKVGTHNITLTSASSDVKFDSFKTALTVNKLNLTITPKPYSEYYGTDGQFEVVVTNTRTGEVLTGVLLKLYLPDLSQPTYYVTTNEGIAKLGVKTLVSGNYRIEITNNDTENINATNVTSTITIKYIPITISTNNVKIYYNSGTTTSIKIIDKRTNKPIANAFVFFHIDSGDTLVGVTNSKGVLTFSASLNVGTHKLYVTNVYNPEGRSVYSYSPVTRTITVVKASATIKAPQVSAYYKGGKYFTVTLVNSKNKKPIFNAKVNIRVYVSKTRYYSYSGNTGGNGQLRLSIGFNPGTYKVEVLGADNKNYAAKTVVSKIVVKKAPTKLIPTKLAAKKGKNAYFKVTAKNTKTKKGISGIKVKIKVYTGKRYKTYTVKTNSIGIAKLNVKSLSVGNHKAVVTSANKYCVAKAATSYITIKK